MVEVCRGISESCSKLFCFKVRVNALLQFVVNFDQQKDALHHFCRLLAGKSNIFQHLYAFFSKKGEKILQRKENDMKRRRKNDHWRLLIPFKGLDKNVKKYDFDQQTVRLATLR